MRELFNGKIGSRLALFFLFYRNFQPPLPPRLFRTPTLAYLILPNVPIPTPTSPSRLFEPKRKSLIIAELGL